jgi:hypothetical protein
MCLLVSEEGRHVISGDPDDYKPVDATLTRRLYYLGIRDLPAELARETVPSYEDAIKLISAYIAGHGECTHTVFWDAVKRAADQAEADASRAHASASGAPTRATVGGTLNLRTGTFSA